MAESSDSNKPVPRQHGRVSLIDLGGLGLLFFGCVWGVAEYVNHHSIVGTMVLIVLIVAIFLGVAKLALCSIPICHRCSRMLINGRPDNGGLRYVCDCGAEYMLRGNRLNELSGQQEVPCLRKGLLGGWRRI